MEGSLILSLFTAFGLGSVITTIIQSWLSNKNIKSKRIFDERKEAFVGLLEAYHKAAVDPSEGSAKNFAYWQIRCELVGSEHLASTIRQVIDTNDSIEERYIAESAMKIAMRNDLFH